MDPAAPIEALGAGDARCSARHRPAGPAPSGLARRSAASPGTRRGPSESNAPRGHSHWEPAPQPDRVDGEEVARDDACGLLAQERAPGGGRPPWRGIQPVTTKGGADRGRGDLDAKPQELALDALLAPVGVLLGEADDQLLHVLVERRPSWSVTRVGPRADDQPPVPAQQRLWGDQEAGPAGPGSARLIAASKARSAGSSLGRGTWRRSTASCWRSTRISRSLAASPRASSARSWTERHNVR